MARMEGIAMTGDDISAAEFFVGVFELGAALVVASWLVIHVIGPAAIWIHNRWTKGE